MNTSAHPLLHRWLTLLLVGLLALGPFLHSHVGASHDTGFHLDGVHAVHAQHDTTVHASSVNEEESPALGVSASLPHPEDEGLPDLAWALLLALLPMLPLQRLPLPRSSSADHTPSTLYRPGLPPPGLAPPAA